MSKSNQEENLELRSEEVQEILTNPPSWIVRWGISLISMFSCMILILLFIIKYPDFVSATVIVSTKQPTERIISRNSGALERINIENGDTVFPNQRIAVIRNTAVIEDVYTLKEILSKKHPSTKNFFFPIDSTSRLILGDIEPSYIAFEKSYMDYHLLKELKPYTGQLLEKEGSLSEIKIRLKDQLLQKQLLGQEFKLTESDFQRHKTLFEKGVISQQEFEFKESEYLQMQKNISAMAISISQLREAISSTNQNIVTTRLSREEDSIRFLKNLYHSFNELEKSIRDWEHNYVLKSSINGIVAFHEYWGENQYINSGEVVFSVMPVNTLDLLGKLTIPSQNAGKVKIGQKVLIKLNNYPYQQFGMLIGKVENFSNSPDKEGNYLVYISIPNGPLTSYNKKIDFNQEMIGNAEIITEELSIAERLFYTFKNIFKY